MARRFVISWGIFFLCAPLATAQQDVTWTNLVNATAFDNTLQKTAGCDGCQDAGGVTQQQIARGTGSFQFALGTGQEVYAGITQTTATPIFYTALDYAFAIYSDDSCEIREFGIWKADCAFTAGDVLKIAIEPGPIVKYYRNGGAISVSASIPTSYPYVLGADLFNLGATIANAQLATKALVVPVTYKATTSRNVYPNRSCRSWARPARASTIPHLARAFCA